MADRPTGTITFLFTDIEGSTKLWERHPDAMKAALARHDALIKQAIEARGGYVFKTVGDAFCAAFAEPTDALEAALAAQRALNAETWAPEIGAIRIRAALHTGVAEEREGDYFGPPVNRVARLLSAGHGGQTLITLATQALLRDNLPPKTSLLDLGEHRLKDLFRPEHIYQIATDGLAAEFPPLRTLDVRITNLPAQPTPFIGRERELAALMSLLDRPDVRLVTLTGAGGTGKTRLSLQAAADLIDQYEHGAYFVALDAIRDPSGVVPQVAAALGFKPSAESSDMLGDLKVYVRERQILLVLDNFEQVVEASPAIGELVAAAPRLKVMMSSRMALNLYGEHDFPVPPLGLPDRHGKLTAAATSQYESVALFIQRAKAVRADFEINEGNAPAIAEICVRLDGLPLAIELAAARIKMFPPQAIMERLDERLKMLTGGARNLPARQQTLRGAIDWSYDLLDDDEKKLFARLGGFTDGWTLDAAETICQHGLQVEVVALLESLQSQSMIRSMEAMNSEPRFVMLETIREYAAEKLEASRELIPARQAHAAYFAQVASRAEGQLTGPDQAEWLARLDADYGNLVAALSFLAEKGEAETALTMTNALTRYWYMRARWQDRALWINRVIDLPGEVTPIVRARALISYGHVLRATRVHEAKQRYEEALELCRRISDQALISRCLINLGNIALNTGDYAAASERFEEGVSIGQKIDDQVIVAGGLISLGEAATRQGEYGIAGQRFQEALALERSMGNMEGVESATGWLGFVALWQNNLPAARQYLQESLELGRQLQDSIGIVIAQGALARLALREGDASAAQSTLTEALTLLLEASAGLGETSWNQFFAHLLDTAARLGAASNQMKQVVTLMGAAQKLRESAFVPAPFAERAEHEQIIAAAHEAIGKTAFESLWNEGRAMPLDSAVNLALNAPSDD